MTRVNDDETVFYTVEGAHLDRLKAIAKRLYTEDRMNGDEMRDAAHGIMAVVRYAEAIGALRDPGEPYVHLCSKEERDLHDGAVAVLAKAGKGPANG